MRLGKEKGEGEGEGGMMMIAFIITFGEIM